MAQLMDTRPRLALDLPRGFDDNATKPARTQGPTAEDILSLRSRICKAIDRARAELDESRFLLDEIDGLAEEYGFNLECGAEIIPFPPRH